MIVASPAILQGETTPKSLYTNLPADPGAVHFTPDRFDIHADGTTDDSAALQQAIDQVAETTSYGIVFIPEGTYSLTRTVNLWRGIRLIGYGKSRPVLTLPENTPGYGEGMKHMVRFCHKPSPDGRIHDANNTSYCSAMKNIDIRIAKGNPGAVAVRFRVPQLGLLEHMRFDTGDGLGAVDAIGNLIEHCEFSGGEWAVKTGQTSAGWQATLMNCTFQAQRTASVISEKVGLNVIHCRFSDTPDALLLPTDERLYVENTSFERIGHAAISARNNFTRRELQINLRDIRCKDVPFVVRLNGKAQGREKADLKTDFPAPGGNYQVEDFSHGILLGTDGSGNLSRKFDTRIEQKSGAFPVAWTPSDVTDPPPSDTWTNIVELGAIADGETDCSDILEAAIAEHKAIYFPMGDYLISRTIELREDTVLIGLQPFRTRLFLKDGTPGFSDPAVPTPMVATPSGGSNGIMGVRLEPGENPGAVGLRWKSGERSFVSDTLFVGPWPKQHRVEHLCSIQVTDGGGGIFKNIWAPDTRAACPLKIERTETRGRIYQVSLEHHVSNELLMEDVSNWTFHALQTEADRGSERCLPVSMKRCRNIRFSNPVFYRTTGVWEPFPTAIRIDDTTDLDIAGMWIFAGGPFAFDNCLTDSGSDLTVPLKAFSRFSVE